MEPYEERAIAQVKSRNDLTDAAPIRLNGSVPFLDGTLSTIAFKRADELQWEENYYYQARNDSQLFATGQTLAEFVSRDHKFRSGRRWDRLWEFTGISGLLALIITLVISFLVIFEAVIGVAQISVPEILANALTTILGFYFGKATSQASA
jgi:hypothetical protein